MQQANTVFGELELCLVDRPNSRRFTILRKLTDLFLAGAETYSDESIQFFDELMGRLIARIERQALIELSQKLAPVDRAPRGVIGRLSNDDDFAIAQPVLEQSNVLTESDLVQIAKTKSQDHLYAIASRAQISAPVTDVLVERGDSRVAGKVTGNTGARFSRWGLTQAIQRAEHDEAIAVAIVNRADLPDDLLEELVRKATKVVQKRLMASSRPETQQRISRVLRIVSDQVARSASSPARGGRTLLKKDLPQLRARISQYAEDKNIGELTDTLAIMAELPVATITKLAAGASGEALVALSKACGIGWQDTQKMISALTPQAVASKEQINALFDIYAALSPADAQRMLQVGRTNATRNIERLREFIRSGPAPAAAS
jgi:uncharacterized protein (DUF2336 family)